MFGDPGDLAILDPGFEFLVALHQLLEVGAPEPGNVAFERARVRQATGTHRPMAAETIEFERQVTAAHGGLLFRDDLPRVGAEIDHQIVELGGRDAIAVGRHA